MGFGRSLPLLVDDFLIGMRRSRHVLTLPPNPSWISASANRFGDPNRAGPPHRIARDRNENRISTKIVDKIHVVDALLSSRTEIIDT